MLEARTTDVHDHLGGLSKFQLSRLVLQLWFVLLDAKKHWAIFIHVLGYLIRA